MLEVYAFSTPNSIRVPVALEEMGLEYTLRPINVRKGEQKEPAFKVINPNGKVPVLVDPAGPKGTRFVLTESSAILIYLAEKTGKLLPRDGEERARVFEQIFFHVTGIGPAFGQAGYFQKHAPEQIPHALTRFSAEAARVMNVFDGMLASSRFAAGDDFTIADIAHFGWIWRREFAGVDLAGYANVLRWYGEVADRPAVQQAVARVTALAPAT
ncbi:glutathione S-transferase family protein [Bradyrhizobium genosp. P]|uniref:glutathione S-transferase family protein n=1 Tax=Bradyrhizobium genosp. P TaxID=83641 RepID=UPI003CE96785